MDRETEIRLVVNALSQSGGGATPLSRDWMIAAVAEQTDADLGEIAAVIDRMDAQAPTQPRR